MAKQILIPGPDHPIDITMSRRRVTVIMGGQTIAETDRALVLQEAGYPGIHYIPREDLVDVGMAALEPSDTSTYCPYKGDASYFNVRSDDHVESDAVWSYEAPYAAVQQIAGHLAFDPSKVQIIEH